MVDAGREAPGHLPRLARHLLPNGPERPRYPVPNTGAVPSRPRRVHDLGAGGDGEGSNTERIRDGVRSEQGASPEPRARRGAVEAAGGRERRTDAGVR